MKIQAINQFGDVSVFEPMEVPVPVLKPGYALVRVKASSVNPVDTKLRAGKMPAITPEFPAVLHGDFAGIIEAIDHENGYFSIGDEVFGCAGGVIGEGGALAEYMLVDIRLMEKKPANLTMMEAAALPLVSITAWEALFEKTKLSPDKKILIHGGTGGVGHIAIQLAKWAGAEVYATVSSIEKAAIVETYGAIAINYHEETVQDYVNQFSNGAGFDVVFDTVGGANVEKSIEAVAAYGDVIILSGPTAVNIMPLYLKSASLHGVLMLLPLLHKVQRERHGEILKQIKQLAEKAILKPLIDPALFNLEDVGKAHALLESGKALGKIVINIP